eukprot:jgi/Mesen1/5528/ME000279S04739
MAQSIAGAPVLPSCLGRLIIKEAMWQAAKRDSCRLCVYRLDMRCQVAGSGNEGLRKQRGKLSEMSLHIDGSDAPGVDYMYVMQTLEKMDKGEPASSQSSRRSRSDSSGNASGESLPSSPAETAKHRLLSERRPKKGSFTYEAGEEAQEPAAAAAVPGPSGRSMQGEAGSTRAGVGQSYNPNSTRRSDRPHLMPELLPSERRPRANQQEGRKDKGGGDMLPSSRSIAVTLGACAFALALAVSRYGKGPQQVPHQSLPATSSYALAPTTTSVGEASFAGTSSASREDRRDQLLGHYRVEEAPLSELKPVLGDGSVKLRAAAADAFLHMQAAARRDGIFLDQQALFFEVKAERNQPIRERARVSAPPGYSEHHTGYAIDVGDADSVETHVEFEFEQTAAFHWLQANANRYHFEMSFPPDNTQGVMYEPWHWRFVGDNHSTLTFYGRQ